MERGVPSRRDGNTSANGGWRDCRWCIFGWGIAEAIIEWPGDGSRSEMARSGESSRLEGWRSRRSVSADARSVWFRLEGALSGCCHWVGWRWGSGRGAGWQSDGERWADALWRGMRRWEG